MRAEDWISVEDALPPCSGEYLICAEIGREIGRSKSTVRRWRQKSCLPAQEHEGTT